MYPKAPPVHPQPSFYETTVVQVEGRPVTHATIEDIIGRPRWSQPAAEARLLAPKAGSGKRVTPGPRRSAKRPRKK